jgi:hypothetical protein
MDISRYAPDSNCRDIHTFLWASTIQSAGMPSIYAFFYIHENSMVLFVLVVVCLVAAFDQQAQHLTIRILSCRFNVQASAMYAKIAGQSFT